MSDETKDFHSACPQEALRYALMLDPEKYGWTLARGRTKRGDPEWTFDIYPAVHGISDSQTQPLVRVVNECPLEAARTAIYQATTTEQPQKVPHP